MNNTPDYNNNLAFAPGDWSDSRVNGNTDRTASTIQLIEKIEELEKENQELKELQKQAHEILLQIFKRGYANEVHVDRYFDNAEAIMEALLNKEIK